MFIVTINQDTCEGCIDCVDTCPVAILDMVELAEENSFGTIDVAAVTGEMGECTGCDSCMTVCPSGSIVVTEAEMA